MADRSRIGLLVLMLLTQQDLLAEQKIKVENDDSATMLDEVVVSDTRLGENMAIRQELSRAEVADKLPQVSDTAKLLDDIPGVSLQTNGGVSALPVVHGLNDDRVKTEIDGMIIPSACPNHMNPPLSFIDPSNVGSISVLKGVTPVSMGGDSIGGTISVQTADPVFASAEQGVVENARASSFFRSNGDAYGGSIGGGIANQFARIDYTGSSSQSRNYRDGRDGIVRSSNYINQNHAAGLAFKLADKQILELKGGQEHVPFQAYPNARMEMTRNDAIFGNLHYRGGFDWGNLDSRLYLENAAHVMDAGPDQTKHANPNMPMETRARNLGYKIQADILADQQNVVRIGNEFHRYDLDDFWPPVFPNGYQPGTSICFDMCPNTLINLNNAVRDRLGTFAEWQAEWSTAWKSMLGLRYDHTMTNTGKVQGYNNLAIYAGEAAKFNGVSHQRNFDALDLTALLQFTANDWSQYEFGYARKNRAPSLYELYPWSSWSMVTTMIGWFGDGNAYKGNLNLKQETAHNVSFTAEYYEPKNNAWSLKATPYFSYVENFIDADVCRETFCFQPTNGFAVLKTANHDARLWGVDASARADLFTDGEIGTFATHTSLSYVRGERMDGGNLYHMMPFNLKFGLDHQRQGFRSGLEMQFVDSKTDVQRIRHELKTPAYILLNFKTGYQWNYLKQDGKILSIDVGVDNLLDKQYFHPLGGSYIGDYYTMAIYSTKYANTRAVPGMGQSVYVGLSISY